MKFRKIFFLHKSRILQLWIVLGGMIFVTAGCGQEPLSTPNITTTAIHKEPYSVKAFGESDFSSTDPGTKEIIEAYHDICDRAEEKGVIDNLELIHSIVEELGKNGYSAIDSKNQVDMVHPEQIRQFCEQVKAGVEAKATLIVVISASASSADGSFEKYEFTTKDGEVEVLCDYYLRKGNTWEMANTKKYPAYTWVYSGEGYLFFEEYHMAGFDGASGHVAIRVEPLDEMCRKYNRNYIEAIGYELNNLFTSDWSEDNFGELNFYDLYGRLRQMKGRGYALPVTFEEGVSYEIPKSEFEDVFRTFFQIDSAVLRQYTTYHEVTETYQYRERGMFDFAPTPYIPYPEVISYEEKGDGTVKLTVNAVWPEKNTEKAFCHEVVIRLLEDGGFQYVSNHVIPSKDDTLRGQRAGVPSSAEDWEITWYTERLSDDKWEEYYDKNSVEEHIEDVTKVPVQESAETVSLLTAEEKKMLQDKAITAAKQCREFYEDVSISAPQAGYSYIEDFSDEQRISVVECLGEQGLVSVSDDRNMENYQELVKFYAAYASGSEGMATIYEVHKGGNIGVRTFICRNGKIQTYHISINWQEGGIPKIQDTTSDDLEEIKLTKKGYFIYTYAETIMHGNLREYYRVKPLSDECRELTKKYIYGLSFVNYNMLVTNWDAANVEEILMPCMFEDLYRIYTGEMVKPENGQIKAELYEHIMTTFFPVTPEQVRECCGYQESTDSYEYEMIFPRQFPPFGEVVDYKKNRDGTITLYVDGVWPDYNSDYAFTNRIVVRPFEDGTFRYLSNFVEPKELELPIIAK